MNHRTVARRLARVEPAGKNEHGAPVYLLVDAVRPILKIEDDRAPAADLNAERTRLTKAQADKAELELALRRGELLPAEDVVAGWEAAIVRFRSLMMAMPTSLADELSGLNVEATRIILSDRIREALEELANTEVASDEDDLDEETTSSG
ncbi:hypothetical protein [Geminicoccus roseus]|uniref:hypothetical protein n=1 Tax=Geminicoccus roseus TaxID=404900 RepID=UPI0004265631|nr:hypothetical protein [Geminicoccus roseus]